jgi:hypothetical protein
MGGYGASGSNVNFAFDLALEAARDLYELAGVVQTKHQARADEATRCVDGWEGGHRASFDSKMSNENTDAGTIRAALVALAGKFASEWAAARGEQDRINQARWVQQQKDDDSWVEDGAEWIVGEDDYGPPPEDPPVPEPPDYQPTRDPIHPEYEYV